MSAVVTPPGIRLCNPGNIRHVPGTVWQGQSATQTDPAFVQFDDPVYGIRAIVRIMLSYEREGLTTYQKVIDRWAPPNENNSAAYVEDVCSRCLSQPSDFVDFAHDMPNLVSAIIWHENGEQPYTLEQIAQGVALA
jgi:hypothetical protein